METSAQQTVTGNENISIAGYVGGNLHVGDLQIGDLHIDNVRLLLDSQYFEPNLEGFGPDDWIDPLQAAALIELLIEDRLLILGGNLEDKSDCARHLAYLLRERLVGGATAGVQVRERFRGNDPQPIETAFCEDATTILLLVEVSPSQIVGYAPNRLRGLLRQHRAYAIITTDRSREMWDIEAASLEARLWRDLSWESYYGRDQLEQYLRRLLFAAEEPIPEYLLPDGPEGALLIEGVQLEIAAQRLKGPANVRYFTEWLLKEQRTGAEIEAQLAQLEGNPQAVSQWFRQLSARDQLMALGLTLFDGLPDDLLFAGIELLVAGAWRELDPLLPQFDYHDLERFSAYFKQSGPDGGAFRVQCSSRERRQWILRAAWNLQRRRLLATLPGLTDMIRASASASTSAEADTAQRETKAAPERRDEAAEAAGRAVRRSATDTLQLDQALVESLGLIGLLSIDVVKPYYLELAADPSDNVRQLVARALSSWREDHEADLFMLLESWWSLSHDYDDEENGSPIARLARPGEDPRSAVRVVVALTAGYAARFDRANRLDPRLYQLLVALIEDRDPGVRAALVRSTLPIMVAWHFRQLEPLLRTRVLLVSDLIVPVATGAAEACTLRPEESLALLDSWRAATRGERRRAQRDKEAPREYLLASIALTYGYIRCEESKSLLSPAAIWAKLRSILVEESHAFVRYYAFHAIEQQMMRNYVVVALMLQDLVSKITLQDRPAIVEVFVRIYLYQRQRLAGGDSRVELDGRSFGVWTTSVRPLTDIEAALYGWILDDSRPIAQQLAVDIFEAMAETTLEHEERRLRQARPQAQRVMGTGPAASGSNLPQLHSLPPLGHLAVFLAAPRKKKVQAILAPLLAQFIVVQRRAAVRHRAEARRRSDALKVAGSPAPSSTVEGREARALALLERWRGVSNEAAKAISRYLERALSFYRWRWGIVFAVIGLLLSLYFGSRAMIHHLSQPPTSITTPTQSAGVNGS